jgi:hypothetical protein
MSYLIANTRKVTNYIQQHRPEGSRTGANHGDPTTTSGGFGKGQQAAYAVTTCQSNALPSYAKYD